MATGEPKPWHQDPPEDMGYRPSPVSVLVTMIPFILLLLAGTGVQYYLNDGALSDGMEWVPLGFGLFAVAAVVIIPVFNHLDLTPQHLAIREVWKLKCIAWDDIDPDSIGSRAYTFYGIPMFTKIEFETIRTSSFLGNAVSFMNFYENRDVLVAAIRQFQEKYGNKTESNVEA